VNNTQPSVRATTTTTAAATTNSSPPHNFALSPAHSSYKTTNTTDVNSVALYHYSPTGRTFITDNTSKRRFLNDRVRASAVPSQAHPTTQVVTHYDPCLAKAPPILTHGCLLLSLNLGLRRDNMARCPSSQDTDDELPTLMASTSLYGSGNKSQVPLSQHTATCLPDNLDLTFEPLYVSKCPN
jgi:hypothetical protein